MQRFNFQFVFSSIGVTLMIEAVFMLLSALVGEYYHEPSVNYLYMSAIITFCSGVALYGAGRIKKKNNRITKREAFFIVTFVWISLVLFGCLPYTLGGAITSFTNAFFESMSGFTAVGSTTLSNIEAFPKSLLFWRSLTHWIGGIGILIFVMSFISVFGGTAVQLYSAEVTGISEQQFKPRISDITRSMSVTYLFLTLSGFLLLWAGPMDAFDAACHSFSAISTGGFSTKQAGIAHFNSAYVEYVLIVLMFLGATNFTLIFQLLRHFSPRIAKDEEFRWYASLIGIFTFVTIVYMYIKGYDDGSFEDTFRTALFQVVSSISTTAFTTVDFLEWGEFYWFLFLAMVLFCGCEGSTSGGMKISRLILLTKNARLSFKRFVHSQALYMVKINGQVVSNTVIEKALSFIFLYFAIIGVSSIALSLTGMSFNESFGTAISTLGNNGIGLGRFGPSGNFIHATTAAKYILCFLMLVGRLEIFTVLSLIVPSFWKK